jgi:hypothetical protein
MTRYLTMACAGAIGVLLATPALAQQEKVSNRAALRAPDANSKPVIVYRGSTSVRVYSRHPHGGPPGQLKKLYGRIPPGQAKKLYGTERRDSEFETEIEFEFERERNRIGQVRALGSPGHLKKFYGRIPPGRAKKFRMYSTRDNVMRFSVRGANGSPKKSSPAKNKLK